MGKLLILIIIAAAFCKCKRNIEAGIATTVTGIVFDNNKQQPIPDVPILVQEYDQRMYRTVLKRVIDSTRSGLDGRYAITFITTGQGSQYRIGFQPGSGFYSMQDAVRVTVGKDTSIGFQATELHTLRATIQMVNNPNPPMRIGTIAGLGATIEGINKDTTVLLQIVSNADNVIQFNITNPDTTSLYNVRLDTIMFQGFADTFTRTFQVDPRFFPERR